MSAISLREIIAAAIRPAGRANSYNKALFILGDIKREGYVILSPDEVRGIREAALEEAAKVAEAAGNTWSGSRDAFQCTQEAAVDDKCEEIAAAVRSLKGGRDAQ